MKLHRTAATARSRRPRGVRAREAKKATTPRDETRRREGATRAPDTFECRPSPRTRLKGLLRPLGGDDFTPGPHTKGAAQASTADAPAVAGTRAPVFEGFDAGRLAADLVRKDGVAQSAKYTFARLAQAAGPMPKTKAEAEAWFTQHIKPGLEREGFGVDWVQGDKALVRTRENPQGEVIDFVRGADGDNPALAWQSEGPVGSAGPVSDVTGTSNPRGTGLADRAFVMSILSKYPPTNEGVQRAVAELRTHPGYEHVVVLEHPLRLDKLDFGRGVVIDVVVGSGGPSPSWGWMPE